MCRIDIKTTEYPLVSCHVNIDLFDLISIIFLAFYTMLVMYSLF